MKITTLLHWLGWILLCFGIFAGLSALTSFPQLHWLPVVFLGTALFIFRERPLLKAGLPVLAETTTATVFAFIFLAHVAWVVVIPYVDAEENADKACAPNNLEARCYSYSNQNCTSIWNHFEQECREEIKRTVTARRATALTGSIVRKCTYKRLDQSFKGSRRATGDSACQAHFNSLNDLSE